MMYKTISKKAVTDLNDESAVVAFSDAPLQFQEFLALESQLRNLSVLVIYNQDKEIIFQSSDGSALEISPMSELNWIAAKNGNIAISVSEDFVVSTLTKLKAYPDAYLYSASQGPVTVAKQLTATQSVLDEYREAGHRKDSLRTIFVLSYLESALLILLGTAWLGMYAAGLIAKPIGDLAAAARAVRDGDLSVRLDRPKARDEVDDLSQAFNQMTMRLSRQRRDLDSARIEAEARSDFIETGSLWCRGRCYSR